MIGNRIALGSSKTKPAKRAEKEEPEPIRWQFRTLTTQEMELDLVTLLTCGSIVEADFVVGQLASAGISAFIPDQFMAQAMAWNLNALGYVRVQVSPKDYEAAKSFLMESSEAGNPGAALNAGAVAESEARNDANEGK